MIKLFKYLFLLALLLFPASFLVSNSYAHEPNSAEFALTIGAQTGPFETGTGFFLSGEIGVPVMDIGKGRLMGLVNIGVAKTDDSISTEPTVDLVPGVDLPTQTNVDLTTVSIVLGVKYKFMMHNIIQPFVLAGPGINIFLNDTDPGDLPGGIAPQPAFLEERGFPTGQGNVELGLHIGGGIDFNLTEKIFVGAEGRFNWVDRENGSYGTYGVRTGFRF